MIPLDRPLLLDTNILVHLLRGRAAGQWLKSHLALNERRETPLLSVVSLGELLALASKWRWKNERVAEILRLTRQFVIVDLYRQQVLTAYAELSVTWEKRGRRLEQNDLWIAATAAATSAVLVTTDTDFRKLSGTVDVVWIDPEDLKRTEKTQR